MTGDVREHSGNRHHRRVTGVGLAELVAAAADAGSAGVAAAAVGGEVRLLAGEDNAVPAQSVTKLVVALGAGIALRSLGDPVELAERPLGQVFPEWRDAARSSISISGLLGHVSGLVAIPPHLIERADDPVALALASAWEPFLVGTFAYNNAGPVLVAEAVLRLTSRTIEDWLDSDLFRPLGLSVAWARFSDGTAMAHGGLVASARDLAAVGWSALHSLDSGDGLIPSPWLDWLVRTQRSAYPQHAWVHQTVTRSLVNTWLEAGVDDQLIQAVEPIHPEGTPLQEITSRLPHDTVSALGSAVHGRGLRLCDVDVGPVIGWGHDGDGSQWLVVSPDRGAAIAHTRAPENYERPPSFFPPGLVLSAL